MGYEKEYQITRVSDGEGQISENQKNRLIPKYRDAEA